MSLWHAERAWLGAAGPADSTGGPAESTGGRGDAPGAAAGGLAEQVLIAVDGDRIVEVRTGVAAPPEATRLPGLVIPGLVNAHSHAFHRALRGRAHGAQGDFWSWREQMYAVAAALDPDSYRALAAATYAEMALAGITTVAEFHYLHHAPGGVRYDDPNVMGRALQAAARDAGIRLVLLDTCYLQADVDRAPLWGPQLRFGDGDVDGWAARAADVKGSGVAAHVGVAIHSVRACPQEAMRQVAEFAAARGVPLHLHLSEQRKENHACLAAYGRTPTQLCADTGVLGPGCTAVHATHLTDGDIALLGGARAGVCFCPTTERDLADGIGPAHALTQAGALLSVGSDSQAVIDLFEEARAVELDERLASWQRGRHAAESLLTAATAGGASAAGLVASGGDARAAGRIVPGALADFVAVRLDSVRLAGAPTADPLTAVVFAATAADVSHVVCGGRVAVADGEHQLISDVPSTLASAIRAVT